MTERRKHDRVAKELRFHCYIDGNRFDSATVNISQGGAFLRTPDPIPTGAVVVAVPHQQFLKDYPVMLVGKVLRRQNASDKGLGVEWLRCVTRSGFRPLWHFIESFPELWEDIPSMPPSDYLNQPCVGYDFKLARFFLPKGRTVLKGNGAEAAPERQAPVAKSPSASAGQPQDQAEDPSNLTASDQLGRAEAPPVPVSEARVDPSFAGKHRTSGSYEMTTVYSSSQVHPPEVIMPMGTTEFNARLKESTVKEPTPIPMPGPETSERLENPPQYRRTQSSGAITQLIKKHKEELPTNIPVSIALDGRNYEARIRMISLNTIFVISFDDELFDADKLEIKLPVSLHQRTFTIELSCVVLRVGQHVEAGGPGIHMQINSVRQPGRPGIFERYVKFLYYQNVSGK